MILTHAVEQVMQPQTGKRYTLNGVGPQGDTNAIDAETQEQVVIPKEQVPQMKKIVTTDPSTSTPQPAMSNTMPQPFTMSSLTSQLIAEATMTAEEIKQHLKSDINTEKKEISHHDQMIKDDLAEIQEDANTIEQLASNSDLLRRIVSGLKEGGRGLANNPNIGKEQGRWQETKAKLIAHRNAKIKADIENKSIEKMTVQERIVHERGLVANAGKYKADATGHDILTNLPMGETKKIEVGMTEFPKDQKKGKDEGYKIPFKEMDKNQVEMREHFDNEKRLPLYNKERREPDPKKGDAETKDKNLGLSEQQEQAEVGEEAELKPGKKAASLEEQALLVALGYGTMTGLSGNTDLLEDQGYFANILDEVWKEISQQHNSWSAIENELRNGTYEGLNSEGLSEENIQTIKQHINYRAEQVLRATNSSLQSLAEELANEEVPAKKVLEKPVEHKVLKRAPGVNEFDEPSAIDEAASKVKESITKLKNTQAEIAALTTKIQEVQKPFMESLQTATKPLNEEMKKKQDLVKSYIDMAYNSLMSAEASVVAYEQSIFAAMERANTTSPNVTLAQLMTRLESTEPEIAAKVNAIKETMKTELSQDVLEKYLYEYPISVQHEKKVRRAAIGGDLLSALRDIINSANSIATLIVSELDSVEL